MNIPTKWLRMTGRVRKALQEGTPVVALESTIIAHGMPYPRNLETALRVEDAVREQGAEPATVMIKDGHIHVGVQLEDLSELAKSKDVLKVSRRDIPYALASGRMGATTVAGTMIAASMAGVRVFVTGGIGGVHRGAEENMDVSTDLTELGRTSVAVVCAGAKSILDLPKTLEVLETQGVPVIGYGTDEFPAFYTRHSGLPVDYRLDRPEQVARLLRRKWDIGLEGGVIIANPVPEQYAMAQGVIDEAIGQALVEAERAGVKGKKITPYLLAKVVERTQGKSLETNIELVLNNAKVGAQIAVAYAQQG